MTTTTRLDVLDRSVEKANIWINEVAAELGTGGPPRGVPGAACVPARAAHRLPVAEAAQLSARLPLLIRGIYFEGWQPGHAPVLYRHPTEFFDRVANEAKLHGETEASFAVEAAARVLARHVSGGEMEDVARTLPAELRQLVTG